MRKFRILLLNLLVLIIIVSCQEEIEKAYVNSEVASNVLETLSSDNFVFQFGEADESFEPIRWSRPDFGFSASIFYTLELGNADFTNKTDLATVNTEEVILTQRQINSAILNLGFSPGEPADLRLRVRSSVNENLSPVYSSVLNLNITPYLTAFPPLFIVGDAQEWNLNNAVEMNATGPNEYEATARFVNNGRFRFFSAPDWDADQQGYSAFEGGDIAAALENGNDGDSNFLFVENSGIYRIVISLTSKTIIVEEVEEPKLYIIGQDQDWTLENAFELTWLGGGKFEGATGFTNDATFRFFDYPDWSFGFGNYPYFESGEVTDILANANDGDSNFRVVGSTGTYKIEVDLYKLTIHME